MPFILLPLAIPKQAIIYVTCLCEVQAKPAPVKPRQPACPEHQHESRYHSHAHATQRTTTNKNGRSTKTAATKSWTKPLAHSGLVVGCYCIYTTTLMVKLPKLCSAHMQTNCAESSLHQEARPVGGHTTRDQNPSQHTTYTAHTHR